MKKKTSITFRTALLSWLVTIITLLTFVTVIIPEQKRAFLENLHSKAYGVVVSLRDVTAGAVVNADFGTVVDHCMRMLQGDNSLDYLVITRNDGFSLIHDRNGWRQEEMLPEHWHPRNRLAGSGIDIIPLFKRRVFHYDYPFDYSGIQWGWIHVGLSLESYDRNVAAVYSRTGFLAILFMVLSFMASVFYAKRLVKPILNLQSVVRGIAEGNLSARVSIEGGDELASLAASVNTMTEALLKRDKSLQSIRFAAQRFLSTMDWKGVIDEVLEMIGEAAWVNRVYVFENHFDEKNRLMCSPRCKWVSLHTEAKLHTQKWQGFVWYGAGYDRWAELLRRGEMVLGSIRELDPAGRGRLASQGIKSLMLSPIQVDDAWWGIIGLDECENEREWTDAEQDSLRAIADMLGTAIGKQRTREALLYAKEAAEAASQAKTQFLANMSHEIRTPMNGVIGMIDILLHTPLSDQQLRYAHTARSSGEALLGIINDVLDLSKIEAGKLKLEEIGFNPNQTVEEVIALLAGPARQKALELTFSVAPDVPRFVTGDPGRLRQVLLNIVSNAIKFTELGGVVVRLSQTAQDNESVCFRFEVQDTGVGIPVDAQAAIFEPFLQADGSTTRKYGGTGLGLAITRQLVEMMEGEIGVVSSAGNGSTFWFTIVVRKSATHDAGSLFDDKIQAKSKWYARILIAEDNHTNQQVVAGMLDILDCKADVVANGHEAIAALSRHPYDLILMDCQMPEMDGFEATRAIRREEARSGSRPMTVIIALTANAMEGDRERCLAAGMNDYLGKPFTIEQLRRLLEQWLPGAAPGAPPREDGGNAKNTTTGSPAHPSETLVRSEEKEAKENVPSRNKPAPGKITQLHGRVLVADDNQVIREVAEKILRKFGCEVNIVANGREALASMAQRQYDLVLMDCQMPEMDGYEATRAIRESEAAKAVNVHVPIIAMTGGGALNCREKSLAVGMDDQLDKPFNLEQFRSILERWLLKEPSADSFSSIHGRDEAVIESTPAVSDSCVNASPAVSNLGACLDHNALNSLRDLEALGSNHLLSGLIGTYLTDSPVMLECLRNAVECQDLESAHRVAHTLKSSSAVLGATRLAALCIRMETMAGKETPDAVEEILPDILEEFESVREALLREI
ncbi:MAG: response regulator [Pseudomonadota bacterium]